MGESFVEVLRVRGNGQVTLPAPLRRAAKIDEGDTLTVHLREDGSVVLKPVVVLDRLEADLLLRLQLRDVRAIRAEDLRSRAKGLDSLAPESGDRLDRIIALLQDGLISDREFIGHAIALGLPTSAIATLLSARRLDERAPEPSPFTSDPSEQRRDSGKRPQVRICQAFQSLLYLPLYIAQDAGFFADEGVQVEIETAGGGAQAWSSVLAGAAEYSVHDPVFAALSIEKGVHDAVVVAAVCNGQAIFAATRDPAARPTTDPHEFMTRTLRGRTVATQPAPDSQWAVLQYLGFLYGVEMGRDYHNIQVPIGGELDAVLAGRADIGTAFPPQVEVGLEQGLTELFDFSGSIAPYALSTLCTTRTWIAAHPDAHQHLVNALERACQYAYAFPDQAVRIAVHEFPDVHRDIIAAATRRCLRRFFVPQHAYVDGEAWRKSQILNKFVGTLSRYHDLSECVDSEAALHAYRTFGLLRDGWAGPRSLVAGAHAPRSRAGEGRAAPSQ